MTRNPNMHEFRGGGDSYRPGGDQDARQSDFTFRANDQLDTRGHQSYESYRPNDSRGQGSLDRYNENSYRPSNPLNNPNSRAPTGPKRDVRGKGRKDNYHPAHARQNNFAPVNGVRDMSLRDRGPRDGTFNYPSQDGNPSHHTPLGPRKFNSHQNPLASLAREKTPELLVMERSQPGQNKFSDVANVDMAKELEDNKEPLAKRVFLEKDVIESREENVAPKWSNPDVYTALTGELVTSQSSQKGMGIIQAIRKARIDQEKAKDANAVTDNQDFLSLDTVAVVANPDAPNTSHLEPLAPSSKRNIFLDYKTGQLIDLTTGNPAPPKSQAKQVQAPKAKNVFDLTNENDADSALGSKERTTDETKSPLKKRKRLPKIRPDSLSRITPQWTAKNEHMAAPWFKPSNGPSTDPTKLLNEEVFHFYEFVKPKDYEDVIRNDLISRIESESRGFRAVPRGTKVRPFGSFPAGLYLPNGDMDLVLHGPHFQRTGRPDFCQRKNELFFFHGQLLKTSIPLNGSGQCIAKARVPIIKFVDNLTRLHVDLSFDNSSGTDVVDVYRRWKHQYPNFPILASVIKQFLIMRNLNDVSVGGLGGYAVICLVVSFLQHSPLGNGREYGQLLLDFFDFYGNKFDINANYISLNPPGYFPKTQNPHIKFNPNKRDRICIMDPSRVGNDISGGTSAIPAILRAFSIAHAMLKEAMEDEPTTSILSCIIGGHYQLYEDQRRHLKKLWDNRNSSSSHETLAGPPGQQQMMGQVSGPPILGGPPPVMLGNYSVQTPRH